jgi:hypothetical protein
MEPILIPPNSGYLVDGFMAKLSVAEWASEDGHLFSVYCVEDRHNIFIFDTEKMILRDYCLDEFEIEPFQIEASPNDKYVAWNGFSEDKNQVIMYVMNLETGLISQTDGIRFRDWAIIE